MSASRLAVRAGHILRWAGLVLLALLALLLLVAWVGIRVPLARVAPLVQPVVEEILDAELRFGDSSRVRLSLRPEVEIEDLEVVGPDIDLRLDRFSAGLRLLPLLRQRLRIGDVVVDGTRLEYTRRVGEKEATEPSAPRDGGRARWLESLTIDKLDLDDASVVITDADSGDAWRFGVSGMDLAMPEPGRLSAELAGSFQGRPIEAAVDSGRDADGAWVLERLLVSGPGSRLLVSGRVRTDPLESDARLALELGDAEALRRWFGAAGAGLAHLRFEAQAEMAGDGGRVDIERLVLGPGEFSGEAALDLSGPRPAARLALRSERIDLGPMLTAAAPPLSDEGTDEESPGGPNEAPVKGPDEGPVTGAHEGAYKRPVETPGVGLNEGAEEALNKGTVEAPEEETPPATAADAPARRSGEAAEAAPPLAELVEPYLQTLDVDLEIDIDRLDGLPLEVESLSLRTRVAAGRLEAPVGIVLAQVPFTGQLVVDTENEDLVLNATLGAPPSDIGGLAEAFAQATTVTGRHGGLEIVLTARGETPRKLVESFGFEGSLRDAELSYGDRPVGFALEDMRFSASMLERGQATATGELLGQAFEARLLTVPIAQVLRDEAWRSRLEITANETRIVLDGGLAQGAAGLAFELRSSDPDVIRDWIGLELSRPVPVVVAGRVLRESDRLRFDIDPLRLGRSRVTVNALTSGPKDDRDVNATVRGRDIDLQEWAELLGGAEDQAAVEASLGGGVRLDIPILPSDYRILDADFDLAVDDLSYGALRADTIRLAGRSRDGRIERGALSAGTPYGAFDGELSIDLTSQVPRIELQADAAPIRLDRLLIDLGVLDRAVMAAEGASIRFSVAGQTANEMLRSVDAEFLLQDGIWGILPDAGLTARFDEARIVAKGSEPLSIGFVGDVDGQPMRLDLETTSLANLMEDRAATLALTAQLGRLRVESEARGAFPLDSAGASIGLRIDSPSLDELNELLGIDLPPWGPIRLSGELTGERGRYRIPDARLAVGASTLEGDLSLDVTGRPRLAIALVAPLVQLDDFRMPDRPGRERDAGASGASAAGAEVPGEPSEPSDSSQPIAPSEPVAPGEPSPIMSPEAFARLDATLDLDVREVRSGEDRLGAGRLEAQLEDGVFDLERLGLELPGGAVEARGGMRWLDADRLHARLELDVDSLDYGVLARRTRPGSPLAGELSIFARLKADYAAARGLMSGATGALVFGVWPEEFRSGVFDLWAVGLANALMPRLDEDKASVVNCLVGGFNLQDGQLEERVIYVDTSRIQASGQMHADFRSRELGAYLKPEAKRAQIFSFGAPVSVSGAFDDYDIRIRGGDWAKAIFRFITSPIVAPIRWLTEDPEPRDGVVACREAWEKNLAATESAMDGPAYAD